MYFFLKSKMALRKPERYENSCPKSFTQFCKGLKEYGARSIRARARLHENKNSSEYEDYQCVSHKKMSYKI
jgi:hypothetical protein